MLIVMLVHSLVEDPYYDSRAVLLWLVPAGLIAAQARLVETGDHALIRKTRWITGGIVFGIGVLLLAGIMTAVLSSTGRYMKPYMNQFLPFDVGLLQIINLAVFLVFVTILFAFTYKTLSGVKLFWRDVFPGAALAALLFAAGNILLQLYVENIAVGSVYGAASTLVVALLWIYYSAQIFFFGAEFVKVYGRAHGSHA